MMMKYAPCCSQTIRVCIQCLESRESLIEAIGGAYIDSKSNRAVEEKAVKKVITPVKPVMPRCQRWFKR
jgi:hypothetical protein